MAENTLERRKPKLGAAIATALLTLLCLYVGYDKMAVHNAGPDAETMGTIALVAAGICFVTTIVLLRSGKSG